MSFFETISLAVLQGLTEFLPVSSSGHLVLAQYLFGNLSENSLSYFLVLHLATAFAALTFYHREIAGILKSLFPPYRNAPVERLESRRLLLLVAAASVPAALIGYFFKDFLEGLFSSHRIVAFNLFLTGALLFIASRCPPGPVSLSQASWWKALLVGLAQAAAISPGISRSGSTISVGLLLGLRREDAVRFSFILSLPAITGAIVLEASRFISLDSAGMVKYLIGFMVAALVGYLSILLVLKWTRVGRLWYFAVYCWFLSVFAAILG